MICHLRLQHFYLFLLSILSIILLTPPHPHILPLCRKIRTNGYIDSTCYSRALAEKRQEMNPVAYTSSFLRVWRRRNKNSEGRSERENFQLLNRPSSTNITFSHYFLLIIQFVIMKCFFSLSLSFI